MNATEDRGRPRLTRMSRQPAQGDTQQDTADRVAASAGNTEKLRRRLLNARAALTETERAAANAAIIRHLESGWYASPAGELLRGLHDRPAVVAAFWPIRDEPDLRHLLHHWASQEHYVLALPCVDQLNAPLVFRPWLPGAAMRTGRYGIPEPDTSETCIPDVVLVPTLGFTPQGERIGYGGGYYDRTLHALRHDGQTHATIGIAYACGRLQPHEHTAADHDVDLDAVVDELGWTIPAQNRQD